MLLWLLFRSLLTKRLGLDKLVSILAETDFDFFLPKGLHFEDFVVVAEGSGAG